MPDASHRVGVDIGGTFTDLIVYDDASGAFTIGKTLTTPSDPSLAVETGLREILTQASLQPNQVNTLVHGTTLVTNAIIERKGAATALFTTAGFRDVVEIGREQRYELYDLMLEHPKPLVPRYLRFDVPQRTLADGSSAQPLDVALVERLARELEAKGIHAVAISFLHSFTNPADEQAARAAIQRVAPNLRVSLSSEVIPEIREFERTSTTIANVYVQGRVERYLRELQARLKRIGFGGNFFMMLSSGGIATVETAIKFPVRLLESGPAAGALAAAHSGRLCGRPDLLSFDMGGTTAKLCVIADGEPLIAHDFEVDRVYRFKKGSGLPVKIPVIEMIEIGTGGGSLARVDSLGLLKVGPDSAGADPGPVCYGRGGTQPTVTDADLVLGYLDANFFLGGKMKLDLAAARAAIDTHIAKPLGLSIEEAAWGIHQVANESMANAARVHTLERGKDPHRFPLFAFGGAGPVHAYRVALALGSPMLIAPFGAGVMSTVGFLTAPLAFDFVRSWPSKLSGLDWGKANSVLAEMEAEGEAVLSESGIAPADIAHRRQADMRYVGQGHEVRVNLPGHSLGATDAEAIQAEFEQTYRQLYGRFGPPVPIEIINWRVVSSGPSPALRLRTGAGDVATGSAEFARKGARRAWSPEAKGYVDTPIYDRYRLAVGAHFSGPAIVEERESTVIVGALGNCHIDAQRNLVVNLLT
ncbi:MAG: hydantoinase/oxoprolinase family protein [Anaerolineae bacterium]|nr:hydantoinase/oxoprolinase family protein [Anaerolineae bacterium]